MADEPTKIDGTAPMQKGSGEVADEPERIDDISTINDEKTGVKPLYSIECGGGISVETPVTSRGNGWFCKGSIVVDHYIDGGTTIGLSGGVKAADKDHKIFPTGHPSTAGTSAPGKQVMFTIDASTFKRKPDKGTATSPGKTWFATRKQDGYGIGLGYQTFSSGTIAFGGKTFPGESSGKKVALSLYKEQRRAMEFSVHKNVRILVFGGLQFGVTHVFMPKDELQEYAWSPYEINVMAGAGLEFGALNHDRHGSSSYTINDIVMYAIKQLHGVGYDFMMWEDFDKPQAEAQALLRSSLGDTSGVGGGNTWVIPSLRTAMTALGAMGGVEPVHYHLMTDGGLKWMSTGVELAKGIGYIAGGAQGRPEDATLITSGITAVNNLATIAAYELGVDEEHLFAIGQAIGALELALSALFSRNSNWGYALMTAGAQTGGSWSFDPVQGRKKFLKSSEWMYGPGGYEVGSGQLMGQLSFRNQIDDLFYIGFDWISSLLMVQNLFSFATGQFTGPSNDLAYKDTGAPNITAFSAGVMATPDMGDVGYFKAALGLAMLVNNDVSTSTGGAALNADVHFGFWVGEDEDEHTKTAIFFGANASAYILFNKDWGVTVTPVVGIHTRFF